MKTLKTILYVIVVAFAICGIVATLFPNSFGHGEVKSDTIYSERVDTIYSENKDTMPAEKGKEAIRYITIPCQPHPASERMADTLSEELKADSSMTLPVVQKVYSDDSTYTAYVSGVEFEDLPKLDSVIVKRREIVNTINETITNTIRYKPRITFGIQFGYGYGFVSRKIEPFVGFGGQVNF